MADGPRAPGDGAEEGGWGDSVVSAFDHVVGQGIGFLEWAGVFGEPVNKPEERANKVQEDGANDVESRQRKK